MTEVQKKWVFGVSVTVAATVIGFLLLLWFGHFEATAQNTRSQAETKKIQATIADSQSKIIEAVGKLTEIHENSDAERKHTASLCHANQISSCDICRNVGVYDTEACK